MAVYEASNEWVRAQNELWHSLIGLTISQWHGMDEGYEDNDGGIVFVADDSPFRVLGQLRLQTTSGGAFDFGTYQNVGRFGLSLRAADGESMYESQSNREADLSALPLGEVEKLVAHLDSWERSDCDLIEVSLTIAGRTVLIVAAEVMPGWTQLEYGWGEEDFFVFTDPADADKVEWKSPRRYFAVEIGADSDLGPLGIAVPRSSPADET
jgi:hypothetical protein